MFGRKVELLYCVIADISKHFLILPRGILPPREYLISLYAMDNCPANWVYSCLMLDISKNESRDFGLCEQVQGRVRECCQCWPAHFSMSLKLLNVLCGDWTTTLHVLNLSMRLATSIPVKYEFRSNVLVCFFKFWGTLACVFAWTFRFLLGWGCLQRKRKKWSNYKPRSIYGCKYLFPRSLELCPCLYHLLEESNLISLLASGEKE